MEVTRDGVSEYLKEVKKSVNDGRYQISPRTKNQSLYIDYVFSEERCKEILYIFGKEVMLLPKQGGSEETVALYIKFNKLTNLYVIVISFHKQDYPLNYIFK